MHKNNNKIHHAFDFVITFCCFTLLLLAYQYFIGAFSTDLGNHWDEAVHFVSALAIADYILSGIPSNPVTFITDYYVHFPKVAIGHWPPFFEFLQSIFFIIFGGTAFVAMVTQAIIIGLCLTITALVTAQSFGRTAGYVAAAIVLTSRIILPMLNLVMADVLEALLVTLTALAWAKFYEKKNWHGALLFALAASLSLLTKGTALGLGLMPLIYLAFRNDFAFLLNRKTIAAAAVVGFLTAPWYIYTYQMAADGFMHNWGWDYTHLAAPYFLMGLFTTVGIICMPLYFCGIVKCFVDRGKPNLQSQPDILAFAATSLTMIVFAMILPAYLDLRYLIPALPSIMIVMFSGCFWIMENISWAKRHSRILHVILPILLLASNYPFIYMSNVRPFHSQVLANEILLSHKPNNLVLISGSVKAEGAFIASFSELDKHKTHYLIRGQKALATSSWMTDRYEVKFKTASAVSKWINQSGIGWVVLDFDAENVDFPHNILVKEAIDKNLLKVTLIKSVDHAGGQMSLYSLPKVTEVTKISENLHSAMLPGHLAQ